MQLQQKQTYPFTVLYYCGNVLQALEVVHIDRTKLHNLIVNLKALDRQKEAEHLCSLMTGNTACSQETSSSHISCARTPSFSAFRQLKNIPSPLETSMYSFLCPILQVKKH